MDVFFFVVCFTLLCSQVTLTTATPPVTVACPRTTSITATVIMTVIFVSLAGFGQHGVVLLPQLILRDTIRGSVGLTTVPQQQPCMLQMPSKAYANWLMVPLQGVRDGE